MYEGWRVAVLRTPYTHTKHTKFIYLVRYGFTFDFMLSWTYRASSFAAWPLSGPSNTSKIERSALHERSEPRVTQRGRSDHSGRSMSPSRLYMWQHFDHTWLITARAWIALTVRVTLLSRPSRVARHQQHAARPTPVLHARVRAMSLCTSPLPRSSPGAHRPRPSGQASRAAKAARCRARGAHAPG